MYVRLVNSSRVATKEESIIPNSGKHQQKQ